MLYAKDFPPHKSIHGHSKSFVSCKLWLASAPVVLRVKPEATTSSLSCRHKRKTVSLGRRLPSQHQGDMFVLG